MSDKSEAFLIIFGAIGWLLSLYFGFFRYKHYQWAKRKVQFDLFTRINQKNHNLFLKASTLIAIKDRNKKIAAKLNGVLIKYLENFSEKVFLMRSQMVSKEIALFWANGMLNELYMLAQQDPEVIPQLQDLYQQKNIIHYPLDALFEFVGNHSATTPEEVESLYTALMK